MKRKCLSRQEQLFPGDLVTWETLTDECQQSVCELLSLFLEQALARKLQQTETTDVTE